MMASRRTEHQGTHTDHEHEPRLAVVNLPARLAALMIDLYKVIHDAARTPHHQRWQTYAIYIYAILTVSGTRYP